MVDPNVLIEEIDGLQRARASTRAGCSISGHAHLILPYHKLLDAAGEGKLGKLQIGTTRRGIGPCYEDKAARLGHPHAGPARRGDPAPEDRRGASSPSALALRLFAKDPALDLHAMTEEYRPLGHQLAPLHRRHAAHRLGRARRAVSSSSSRARRARCSTSITAPTRSSRRRTPVAGAACTGAGVGPKEIDEVWGIAKAYATRVGAGPVPDRARRRARRAHARGAAASTAPPPGARGAAAGSTSSALRVRAARQRPRPASR